MNIVHDIGSALIIYTNIGIDVPSVNLFD